MTRRKIALLVSGAALAVAVLVLLARNGDDPDHREARPPTPVSNEPVVAPVASESPVTAPLTEDPEVEATSTEVDRAACEGRFSDFDRLSRDEINKVLGDAAVQLRNSGSREYALAAAIIERRLRRNDAESLLSELESASTYDPLALWTLLTICESGGAADCDFAAIEATVRRNHSGNSALWMAVVGQHLETGQEAAALDAMRMAVGAPIYDSYFAEQFLNIDRALAATTNWSATQRAFHTVDFVATSPPGYSNIMSQCKRLDAEWNSLCDDLAARLADDADEIMARGFGTALRLEIYEARNGSDGIAKMRDELQKEAFAFMRDEEKMAQSFNALLNDETLLRMFLENLESYGEIEAFARLLEDVERLRNTDGYDQCNFAANPYTQL